MVNIGVHSRDMGAASDPPSHQSYHRPPSGLSLADERAPSVPSASIFSILCPRAHLSLGELEPVSNSRLFLVERSLQGCVALRGRHQGDVNLVLDELEGSRELILSPASGPAPCSCAVAEDMIKLLLAGWEAGRGHIGVLQVNNSCGDHHCDVVAESFCIELRVANNLRHSVLNVAPRLRRVEAAGIVFPNSHFHTVIGSNLLQVMRCSQDLASSPAEVVVEALGNKSAGAEEVVVLVENETGPWELARSGLPLRESSNRPPVVS